MYGVIRMFRHVTTFFIFLISFSSYIPVLGTQLAQNTAEVTVQQAADDAYNKAWQQLKQLSQKYNTLIEDLKISIKVDDQHKSLECYLCLPDSTPISTVRLHAQSALKPFYIGWVGTDPNYRKRGYASLLLQTLFNLLREIKAEYVDLDAVMTARSLYKKLGFYFVNEPYAGLQPMRKIL